MTRPWHTLDAVDTPFGRLELRRRGEPGERDFLMVLDGRILMNSRADRSERALAERSADALAGRAAPRVLLSGLGMGVTLRVLLDALPSDARVEVVDLEPRIVEWCRGPLAPVCRDALADPRVSVRVGDVADRVAALAREGPVLDALVLDLHEGPHAGRDPDRDPLYGRRALERQYAALVAGGVLAVWGEAPDPGFERRLRKLGFGVERARAGRGGRRHAITLARRPAR